MALLPLSPSYAHARAAFLDAAGAAGCRTTSHVHPDLGLDGEELAVDVAELGPEDAAHVVLVVSATHGVEGYCGSALQRNWLANAASERPDDVRLVLVHALNPYGFSWVRRVNEDNVDLNRNFVDWSAPLPPDDGYAELADLLVPASWSDAEQERTMLALIAVAEEVGLERLQGIVSRGQYTHPDGVFYGGSGPVWSNRWLHRWCASSLGSARSLVVVDLHTGLGPNGVGEAICVERVGTPGHDRARARWGEVTSMLDGGSSSAVLVGDWLTDADRLLPAGEVTAICLEYGTVDPLTVLQALRADAWLHAHGDPVGPDAAAIRAQVRAAFADDDPAWLDAVWARFLEILGGAW